MSRISLQTLKQTVGVGDAILRFGQDGRLKTAAHGFFGRAVRWLFGATKKDRIDNKKILGDLLQGLREKFGREAGTRAFLAARPEAYLSKSGDVMVAVNKPVKSRQVQVAVAQAKASPLRYAPGGDKFAEVARLANVPVNLLSQEQVRYFKSRLMEHVGLKARQGKPLDKNGIKEYATKLLMHTANNVGDNAPVRQLAYDSAKQTTLRAIVALSRGDSQRAPDLLLDLSRSCEQLVLDTLQSQGKDAKGIGPDDKENVKQQVIHSAISRLTPRQAKELYENAMSSGGTGRQLLLAIRLADWKLDLDADYDILSHQDLRQTTEQLIYELGARAGIAKGDIDTTLDTIFTSPTTGRDEHGVPKDALSGARVKDGHKVGSLLTGFQAAIKRRSLDLQRNEVETSNVKTLSKFWATDPGEGLTDGFEQLAGDLKLNPRKLTDLEREEYNIRLRENVEARSQLHSKELSEDDIAQIARESLKQVRKLSRAGVLDQAVQARTAYTQAVKDFILGLAGNKDTVTLLGLMKNVNERLNAYATAEMIEELGSGEFGDLTDLALNRAGIPKDVMSLARRSALRNDAPLRAISSAATNTMNTIDFSAPGAQDRLASAGRIFSLANVIVNGFASHLGTDLGKGLRDTTDVDVLTDGKVSETMKQQAQQALTSLLSQLGS